MSPKTLAQVAAAVGGELVGPDGRWDSVSTDSRRIGAGSLFIALEGPRFDGHAFVGDAGAAGAAAAMVSRPVEAPLTQILVADTRRALGRLAAVWRAGFNGTVVALTGSNGKTTCKEMIRAILAEDGETLATEGNLNNDIGVPLTLLRLQGSHRRAVIELGANHPGEIAWLTSLVAPDVGLVTNAGPAHLEGFGDLDGVARAKGELFAGLPEQATAVINADDRYAPLWRELAGDRPVLRFGVQSDADFSAERIVEHDADTDGWLGFVLHGPSGEVEVELPMSGRHNVVNAVAAAAAATAAGATLEQVRAGLARVRNLGGRLRARAAVGGATLYDDSYNANPGSVEAAIRFLAQRPGERWLLLGDMGELGADADRWHSACGHTALDAGLDRLLCVGPLARHAAEAFGERAEVFADVDAAVRRLSGELHPGVTLLVKASRAAGLERAVAKLAADAAPQRGS